MLLALLLLPLLLLLQLPASATPRLMTPHDIWAVQRVDHPTLSPDRKQVAYTVQSWSVEKNRATSQIWLQGLAGGPARRLTTHEAGDGAPVFSPDGSKIAFVSQRDGDEAPALYLLRLDGGEAEKILELPFGVDQPQWLPDGQALVLATRVIPALVGQWRASDLAAMKQEMLRRQRSKMTAKVTEERQYRYFDHWLTGQLASRLLRLRLSDKSLLDLTPDSNQLFEIDGEVQYDIAPDGKHLVLAMNTSPAPHRTADNLDLVQIPLDGNGKLRNLTLDNRGVDDQPHYTPDGRAILFLRRSSPYFDGTLAQLWRHDLATGHNTPLGVAPDLSVGEFAISHDGKRIWLLAEERGETALFSCAADGSQFNRIWRSGTLSNLSLAAGSAGGSAGEPASEKILLLKNTFSQPNEVFVFDPAKGEARQLSHVNDARLAELKLGKVESYQFKGGNDEMVQGWLIFPPDFDPKKTYPLLHLMHGGPHTMVGNGWNPRWHAHAMAAPGYVVTWVNRHGSTGFGEAFATSIHNQWGILPTQDLLRATDYLIARWPNIDGKKVAAAGASYGGYLAAWLEGNTDRFTTLINHAGVSDFVTQYGSDITNYTFERVLGGTPWNNPQGMAQNNPIHYAKNFKTPMLLTHGETDYRVPYGNSTALYGILQAMQVPSRLVIFPNENHWILSPQNSIYWYWEVQSWLQRHIGGTPTLPQPNF
jgi:dipeptidyl aminopeptidase/acylaminoacyl peptidase